MVRIVILLTVFIGAFIAGIAFWGPQLGWFGGPGLCAEGYPCSQAVIFRPEPEAIMGWAFLGATVVTSLVALVLRLPWGSASRRLARPQPGGD